MYAYLFFKEKGSIHIVQSARCLFILFVFYNLYIYIVRLSPTMIYCVTTHFPFLLLSLLLSFFIMKKYICPKKSSVIYFSWYRVSISPLQAVNCIPWAVKICLFLSNLYHRCLCHTYINACLGCVFIYWEYISHFMYRSVSGLFTTIITDQRDSLNGFAEEHCKWCNTAVVKQKRKKESQFCFFFSYF